MALENAPPKGKGTIGGIKKEYVYIGGGILVVVGGIAYYRSKKQAAAAATSQVTDPAGNVCSALDPNSGYCPGSPEDLAYQGNLTTPVGFNSASSVGGQIIGYDQFGNPIYSQGPTQNTGPGTFTSNAAWSQAALQYLIDNEPNADPSVIGAALAAYLAGEPVTSDQKSICEQAIAFEGMPPVSGTNGNPPNFVDSKQPPPPTGKISNLRVTAAYDNITGRWTGPAGATSYTILVTDHQGAKTLSGPDTTNSTTYTARGLPQKQSMAFHVTANPGGQTAVAYTETKGTAGKSGSPIKKVVTHA